MMVIILFANLRMLVFLIHTTSLKLRNKFEIELVNTKKKKLKTQLKNTKRKIMNKFKI